MAPPGVSFDKLCKAAQPKIVVPVKAQQLQFLADSGITSSPNAPAKELLERCSALEWARASLSAGEDPDSWSTTLDASLHPTLLGLYLLPPHRGPGAAPSNFARLASTIQMYDPTSTAASGSSSTAAGNATSSASLGTINTLRPSPQGSTSTPTSSGSGAHAQQAAPPQASPGGPHKRAFALMHDELAAVLPSEVYHALDTASHMEPEKRVKFHAACKNSTVSTLLDNTVSAAFGHQVLLTLAEGQHFDPIRRGRALAIAGRSAPSGNAAYNELLSRETHLQGLQKQWPALFAALQGDHEIASTLVNNLWSGVTFVFTLRAARATHWNCQEVEDACRHQLDALPAYRSAISNNAARLAAVYDAPENARQVNKHYAAFFLPFWWEHVLLRGILDHAEHQKIIDKLCVPSAPPLAPAHMPLPPPAALPPPAYPLPALPGWAPPFATPPPMGMAFHPAPLPPPPYGLPYGPGVPPPYAPPAAPAPAPRTALPPFAGKTVSALICGNNFGIILPGNPRLCACAISRAFPGRIHHPFECPIRLHLVKGACPGWTPTGQRIASAWAGDDITTATQAEWRAFQATLTAAIVAKGTPDVTF